MKDLIAALAVLANSGSSEEEKAAALEKLTAYFNSQLEAEEKAAASKNSESGDDEKKDGEQDSESGDDEKKDEPSKEMASALATIKTLTDRVAKLEKASAAGNAPRATKPTVIPRTEPAAPKDPVVSMIETAERNTIRNLSK